MDKAVYLYGEPAGEFNRASINIKQGLYEIHLYATHYQYDEEKKKLVLYDWKQSYESVIKIAEIRDLHRDGGNRLYLFGRNGGYIVLQLFNEHANRIHNHVESWAVQKGSEQADEKAAFMRGETGR